MFESDVLVQKYLEIKQREYMKINVQLNQGQQPMNKCLSFSDAAAAISAGQFVVASVDKSGSFSMAANPVLHATVQQARAEARRLASVNTGKMFAIIKLFGAEFVPAAPQPFSI